MPSRPGQAGVEYSLRTDTGRRIAVRLSFRASLPFVVRSLQRSDREPRRAAIHAAAWPVPSVSATQAKSSVLRPRFLSSVIKGSGACPSKGPTALCTQRCGIVSHAGVGVRRGRYSDSTSRCDGPMSDPLASGEGRRRAGESPELEDVVRGTEQRPLALDFAQPAQPKPIQPAPLHWPNTASTLHPRKR